MHDGQNLFDPAMSFSGSWNVDVAMAEVSLDGLEAIVVGIPNMGHERIAEYSPFEHPELGGGRGDLYLDFLINTVKPLIDDAVSDVAGPRAHGHRRLVDGRTDQPLRILPLSTSVRLCRRAQSVVVAD